MNESPVFPAERIQSRIIVLRGQRVLLDTDLATIYEVPTRQLNQAVKRNLEKFPEDFMFQLTKAEAESVRSRSQSVTLNAAPTEGPGRGKNIKYLPYAFTEHGAIQAANILRSDAAIQMSVQVVRAFVQLRRLVVNHKAIAAKLAELDARIGAHDDQLRSGLPACGEHPAEAPLRCAPGPHASLATISALPRFVAAILEALRQLAEPVLPANRRRIGFNQA
jgi:hypothetical protein